MPVYSLQELTALKDSELVRTPEFVYTEQIETVPEGTHTQDHSSSHSWRRPSHGHSKRQPVTPKAAISFSQKSLFDTGKPDERDNAVEDTIGGEAEDDEFAARFLLKNKQKPLRKQQDVDEDGTPIVNLSYAAALAATMKMSESQAQPSEEAVGDEDGWVSVEKPRRNRNKGSFSKWRS